MDCRIAERMRVQAFNENGQRESARVLKVFTDAVLVSFNGYETQHDHVVAMSEVKNPVA